jgi:recombination protein RecT
MEEFVMSEENNQEKVIDTIRKNKFQLEEALPKHMTADKIIRMLAYEFKNTPAMKECTAISVRNSLLQAAFLGLNIGGILGECYLIPYKNRKTGITDCQFQLGYKGMLALAYRSDRVHSVNAHCVYENDKFSFRFGSDAFLHHEPCMGDRGKLVAVYAEARMNGNSYLFNVLYKNDIEKAKAKSSGAKYPGSIWEKHYDEMAMKTAIRRLFKYLPISLEMQRAIALDEAADDGRQSEVIDSECENIIKEDNDEESKSKSDKISELL